VAWLVAGLVGVAAPSSLIASGLLGATGAGTLVIVLVWGIQQWLRRIAVRSAARLAAPQASRVRKPQRLVYRLREDTAGDCSATLTTSVLFCGATDIGEDNPHAQAAEEIARLLMTAGFDILTDEGGRFLETGVSGALPACPDVLAARERALDARDGAVRATDALPRLLSVATVCAIVVFPGGLESLAALIEALCAMQKGVLPPAPLILYDSAAWQGLRDWLVPMLAEGALVDLMQLRDDPALIASQITASGADCSLGAHPSLEPGSASIAAVGP
jgi:predicted Rossmann-fold nucleotide-binding protein